jgi:DNA-binding CsgD family transcriptional regulator
MAAASPERVRRELGGLAPGGAREFALQAARVLARAVPFDGVCVLTMDPTTHLPTGEIVQNGLPAAAMARMAGIELSGADVNTFAALARADQHAAGLSAATDGDLDRSRRHRELRRPHGLGDELRAALVVDGTTWGALTLLRGSRRPDFAPGDTALVAAVADALAAGLRRATLTEAVAATRAERGVGVLALAGDDTVVAVDPAAERWLAQLRDEHATAAAAADRHGGAVHGRDNGLPVAAVHGRGGGLPVVVTAVACQARRIADGRAAATTARARVRTADGRWLVLHASTATGPDATTTVVVGPAPMEEVAPLVASAYGLSPRERAVTRLVARGLATTAIGAELHLSPWTVQDHLKAIFGKVGVRSRGELVARLYFPADAADLTG